MRLQLGMRLPIGILPYVSHTVFPILMVHHSLRTNPNKMSIFRRLVTCNFLRHCTHILTRFQGEKFEDIFLVKIASKGTSIIVWKF